MPKILATKVFRQNWEAKERIVVNEGGTRSSKTWSLAQLFALRAAEESAVFTICRKTMPSLKATAMKDFFNIIKELGWYKEKYHNKTDHTYQLGRSEVEFISLDEPQKIRGRKRDYLWGNEANEFDYDDWQQLILRTTKQAFMDYNPSDEYHWIYEKVLTRPDCRMIKSTYLDNPFNELETIKEIERLKEADPNYWKIYGLGERGVSQAKIYTHWKLVDEMPEGADECYGLDFGFNKPSALVKVAIKDDELYWDELLYEAYLTNSDLIARMKPWDQLTAAEKAGWTNIGKKEEDWIDLKIDKNLPIYCDSSEPARIQEFEEAGFNVYPADKGKDSVRMGIDAIKRRKFFITKRSVNGHREARSYSWGVDRAGAITDEPVKVNDHFLDGGRMAVYTHMGTAKPGVDFI